MTDKKVSDLPFSVRGGVVFVFQPKTTFDANTDLTSPKVMEQAFEDAYQLEGLVHVGTFQCDTSKDEQGGAYAIHPDCGGELTIVPIAKARRIRTKGSSTPFALTCSNPQCGLEITSGIYQTNESLSNLFLHLMLKQMVPELPMLNFVDCSARERTLIEGNLDRLHAFGLVSLVWDSFWGYYSLDNPVMPSSYDIGFILGRNLRTSAGSMTEPWLRFLVAKKHEMIKDFLNGSAPFLLGPKSGTSR